MAYHYPAMSQDQFDRAQDELDRENDRCEPREVAPLAFEKLRASLDKAKREENTKGKLMKTAAVVLGAMLLPSLALSADKKVWDCFKVDSVRPIADSAYEVKAHNACDQDFKEAHISLVFTNADGDKIGQCTISFVKVNANDKFHEVQGSPVIRATKISVRKISDKFADVQ